MLSIALAGKPNAGKSTFYKAATMADVAVANRQFLADDGRLLLALKARSEDVTAPPETIFETARSRLRDAYEILETERLDPVHTDHLAVVARPR